MKECPHCKGKNLDNVAKCGHCGELFENSSVDQPAASTEKSEPESETAAGTEPDTKPGTEPVAEPETEPEAEPEPEVPAKSPAQIRAEQEAKKKKIKNAVIAAAAVVCLIVLVSALRSFVTEYRQKKAFINYLDNFMAEFELDCKKIENTENRLAYELIDKPGSWDDMRHNAALMDKYLQLMQMKRVQLKKIDKFLSSISRGKYQLMNPGEASGIVSLIENGINKQEEQLKDGRDYYKSGKEIYLNSYKKLTFDVNQYKQLFEEFKTDLSTRVQNFKD